MSHHTLYERLGGGTAITAVVDDFAARCASDSRINAKFARTDIARLKAMLVEQISAATGGKVYESTPHDTGGEVHRFITPAIANGRVYVGSVHAVTAFGLR